MGMHTHITRDDRVIIADGRRRNESYRKIAERVLKDVSSVYQEVQRNKDEDGVYRAVHADKKAKERRRNSKVAYRIIDNNPRIKKYVEDQLHPLKSPETLSQDVPACTQTIYSYIYRSGNLLLQKLPQRGRKRRRYGSKREKKQGWTRLVRSIHERPVSADTRSRVGHFEGDTIRGSSGALLTHTDRKSRFEIVHKLPNEGAEFATSCVINSSLLKDSKSITYDRGSTFALWEMIEQGTNTSVFFADAHSPWQRGTNENSNGRLRRIYPKGTNFAIIPEKDIQQTVWIMNHTKRKCLNWRTPCRVFGKCCVSE